MNNAKKILTPVLAAVLVGTTLASAQTTARPSTQPPAGAQAQQQGDRSTRGPLTVKYYSGNPLKGGTLLSTATLQPQAGSTSNPFATAPKGTTYVAISTPFGTRISTLKDAQAQPAGDRRGPDAAGRGAPNAGQAQAGGPRMGGAGNGAQLGGRPDVAGLRLPGLADANRVTFYAGDPLAGGQAQSSIQLSGQPSAAQQQALTQAASQAKFAVIERSHETVVVNLTEVRGGSAGMPR